MKRMSKEIVFALILSGVPVAVAQTAITPPPANLPVTLSLAECVARAVAAAPAIRSAISDRDVLSAKLGQAKSAYFLPEIKLRVLGGPVPDVPNGSGPEANLPNVATKLTELGPFVQARVEAIQPIFTFGKLSAIKSAAERGVDAKDAQEQVAKNEVIRNVKKVYFGIVALRSIEDFLNELNERATSAKEKVEDLLAKHSGEVTDIDSMRLQVFFAETTRELIEVRSGISLGMVTLGILTGGLYAPPVSPADKVLQFREIQLGPIEYYLSRARVSRPEIRQLDDLVSIKRSLMKASKADFFPMFFLGGFYGFGWAPGREEMHNPFLKDDFNFNAGGVALGFEQKLSFHMTNSRYSEAEAEYRKTLNDRDLAMIGIELEIRKSHSEAVAKRDAVKAARDGFRAGRSWVTATTLNFGVGLVPVKDLLEAFIAYSRVKFGYFDTIHAYDFAVTELARTVGEDIVDVKG